MENKKIWGIFLGLVSAVAYGTNPLFAVGLIRSGFTVESMIAYRFILGAGILFFILRARAMPLKVRHRDVVWLALLGFLFSFSAYTLFKSFEIMSAGVASTILFLYPIFTALIMWAGFKERLNRFLFLAMAISFAGVAILFKGDVQFVVSGVGTALVVASALSYAFYIICIKKTSVACLDGMKTAFYVMVFAGIFALLKSMLVGGVQLPTSAFQTFNLLLLAIIPTSLSIAAIAYSIKYAGATIDAILGAFEPLTAVAIGVIFLGEPFTGTLLISIFLILSSVILIVLGAKNRAK